MLRLYTWINKAYSVMFIIMKGYHRMKAHSNDYLASTHHKILGQLHPLTRSKTF